ncbi:MAG TPA: OsmC family protein [Bacillota bacterium]
MDETRAPIKLNGVDLQTVVNLAASMDVDSARAAELSQFRRSVRVRWVNGLHSQAYTREVPPHGYDEPIWLGGSNLAMAASEALLGAIGGCIAVGFVANASLREVRIDELEIDVDGTIDLPSFFGIRDGNPGYEQVRVTIYVKCDADPALLDEIAWRAVELSPVVNTVRRPVELTCSVKAIE